MIMCIDCNVPEKGCDCGNQDAESFDQLVMCRPASTEVMPWERCPYCGKPLLMVGTKTLAMPTNRTAYCENCPFEEKF